MVHVCKKCRESRPCFKGIFYYAKETSDTRAPKSENKSTSVLFYEILGPEEAYICGICVMKERLKWICWMLKTKR